MLVSLLAQVAPAVQGRVSAMVEVQPMSIDGRLDEPIWKTARPFTAFVQKDPVEGSLPTERTEALVAFNGDALYIGARMHDSTPEKIMVRLARRDRDVPCDAFIVYLDPRYDRRTGAYFALNAAG